MSEHELATRIGITRSTLQRLEKGGSMVDVGLMLKAVTLTGVDLLVPAATTLAPQLDRVDDKLALTPSSIASPGTKWTMTPDLTPLHEAFV